MRARICYGMGNNLVKQRVEKRAMARDEMREKCCREMQGTPGDAQPIAKPLARARRGITLFEAVAAVAIVGATSAAALSAVASQFRTTARAERALVVEALATSRLDFLDLLTTERELQSLPDSVAKGEFPKPLAEYSWTTDVKPVSDEAGLYSVLVTVTWKEGSYRLKTRAYRIPAVVTR